MFCSPPSVKYLAPGAWRGSTWTCIPGQQPKEVSWAIDTCCKGSSDAYFPTPGLDVSRVAIPKLHAQASKISYVLSTRTFHTLGAWGHPRVSCSTVGLHIHGGSSASKTLWKHPVCQVSGIDEEPRGRPAKLANTRMYRDTIMFRTEIHLSLWHAMQSLSSHGILNLRAGHP